MFKLTPSVEKRIIKASEISGKSPSVTVKNALDVYLEELEDKRDIQQRKGQPTISVKELGKRLGL